MEIKRAVPGRVCPWSKGRTRSGKTRGISMTNTRRNIPGVMLIAVLLCVVPLVAQLGTKPNEWHSYGSDNGSTHYSSLDLINRDNFKNMTVAWSWKLDNYGGGTTETTPIMVNNVLYFTVGQTR